MRGVVQNRYHITGNMEKIIGNETPWAWFYFNTFINDQVEIKFFFFHLFILVGGWLQHCSGFCHTLIWASHGFTCVPHPDPPSHLPPHPIPLGHASAPVLSTCLIKFFKSMYHNSFMSPPIYPPTHHPVIHPITHPHPAEASPSGV